MPPAETTTSTAVTPIDVEHILASFGDLPTIAPVASQIIQMVDDDDVGINELADVIATDPGLASRLLRLANSAAYSRGQPVTNMARAAMLLGLRTLKMVTLGFSLMQRPSTASPLDGALIWRRSLATAGLGRRLAATTIPELTEDAFTAGLLSNVGKSALLDHTAYIALVERFGPWVRPDDEDATLGVNTDAITARILDGWQIPCLLTNAIGSRHRDDLNSTATPLGSILGLADHASALILASDPDDVARAYDRCLLGAARLGLTIDEVEQLVAMVGPELDDLAGSFDLEAISPESLEDLVRQAQSRLAAITLDVAAVLGEERVRNDELVETNQQLAAAASTDVLTGLPNRRTFDAFLGNQLASRQRHPRSSALGLIILDVDRFKSVNDTYGHAVGDEVLSEAGKRLGGSSRRGELLARTGGEEFALILPEIQPSDLEGASERLRRLMAEEPFATSAGPLPITVSVGASWVTDVGVDTDKTLYKTADAALYESKGNGRNQVTVRPTRS